VHGKQMGHSSFLLLDGLDPHGHGGHVGAGVCCTGGSVVHGKHTGHPALLLDGLDPHGHGGHVGAGVC